MNESGNTIIASQLEELDSNGYQEMVIGTALVVLNLVLMVSVGLYWINPSIHHYFSGRPL